jgi:hypothetical protein
MENVKPCKYGHTDRGPSGCRICNRAAARKFREAHPEQAAEANRLWRLKNKARVAELGRRWRAENVERRRENERAWNAVPANKKKRKEANIRWQQKNPAKVRAWQRKQSGLPEPTRPEPSACECCGRPLMGKTPHLDHCHTTGVFRGWLCNKCNMGIGLLGDNVTGLMRAMSYLTRLYDPTTGEDVNGKNYF